MDILDLGVIEGRVLLFGGPYSNLAALEAVVARASAMGVPPGRCICTGDVVAYGADPADCVALVRRAGMPVVAGNVERQLGAYGDHCGCGFAAGSTCDLLSAGWFAHADAAIGAQDRAWMAALPDMITFEQAGRRLAVIHGGATDVSRFLWPVSDEAEFAAEVAAIQAAAGPVDAVVSGHCGVDFMRRVAGVEWINAGVIGLPPNDGTPQTRFAILDGGQARIEALDYDHARAARAMRAAGLVQGYERALETGFWPSEEVLPCVLRRSASSASG